MQGLAFSGDQILITKKIIIMEKEEIRITITITTRYPISTRKPTFNG